MAKTKQFTVTDAADVPVTALTETDRIVVSESTAVVGWPTSDFLVMRPTAADDAIQIIGGGAYAFKRMDGLHFGVDDVAGYIKLASGGGSTTFCQDER